MKKQICLAGFGDAELESLESEAAAAGSSWKIVFTPDGPAALEKLAAEPFTALVANLQMEGMSGVGLLQLAASDYPRVLRFAIGDMADRENVVTNIGAPHQFIVRPLKIPELLTNIERSLALDAWLSSDKLRAFIPQLGRLPGLPSTYFELLKRTESPHATVASIGEVVVRDPALTARLLQTVNSAAAAVGEKITDPVEAVSVLGLDTVKSLVLCLQVFGQSNGAAPAAISLDTLWKHSFHVAQSSRKIAMLHTSDVRVASDAFTAGLLHRVGQIVLTKNMAKSYADIVNTACSKEQPLHTVENSRLGVTSAQVGAYLLGLWGMPLPLIEAAALYADPERATATEFSLLTAVHVADVLAQEDEPLAKGLPTPKLSRSYLRALGLPEKSDAWRKALAGGQFSAAPPPAETPPEERPEPAPARPRPRSRPRADSGGRSYGWLAMLCVLAVAGYFGWQWYSGRLRSTTKPKSESPSAKSAEAAPAPSAAEPATASDSQADSVGDGSPIETLSVTAIVYSPSKPVALINGHPVSPGDKVNGVTIEAITKTNVTVSYGHLRRVIKSP